MAVGKITFHTNCYYSNNYSVILLFHFIVILFNCTCPLPQVNKATCPSDAVESPCHLKKKFCLKWSSSKMLILQQSLIMSVSEWQGLKPKALPRLRTRGEVIPTFQLQQYKPLYFNPIISIETCNFLLMQMRKWHNLRHICDWCIHI